MFFYVHFVHLIDLPYFHYNVKNCIDYPIQIIYQPLSSVHPLYLMLWSFGIKLAIVNNITPLEEPWVIEKGDDYFELYLGLTMIQQPCKESKCIRLCCVPLFKICFAMYKTRMSLGLGSSIGPHVCSLMILLWIPML